MARRRLTIKRIDPWSVLKFGTLANVAMLAIFLLVMSVVWFIIDRLRLVDQICGIATDIGFAQCGLNAPNVFRALLMLGLLWVVVQTAVVVFLAFLHNLIADLTGGLELSVVDEPALEPSPPAGSTGPSGAGTAASRSRPPVARSTGGRFASSATPDPASGAPPAPAEPRRRTTGQTGAATPESRPTPRRTSGSTSAEPSPRPAPRPRAGQRGDDQLFGGG
ncbi:MAG: DUF3566 domain-containing protein [Nitriliruptoraceae bacterium]